MSTRVALLALLFHAAAACATGGLPALPSQGGPRWVELTSANFVLRTDLPEAEARKAITNFEDFRLVLKHYFPFDDVDGSRSKVIVVRDWDDWVHFGQPDVPGLFVPARSNPFREPFMFYADLRSRRADDHAREIVHHELTHLVSHDAMHYQPRWFAEGLGEYFSTIQIDHARGQAQVGLLSRRIKNSLRRDGVAPLDRMIRDFNVSRAHYNASVLLVSYLLHARKAGFNAYQRTLRRVRADPWHEVFADTSFADMTAAMMTWLDNGHHDITTIRFQRRPDAPVLRVMSDADVLVVRALLHLVLAGRRGTAGARAAVGAALAADERHLEAGVLLYTIDYGLPEARARTLVAAHPGEWLAWRLLIAALPDGEEQDQARRTMCELAAARPRVELPARLCPKPEPQP